LVNSDDKKNHFAAIDSLVVDLEGSASLHDTEHIFNALGDLITAPVDLDDEDEDEDGVTGN
jgi:hypothetical protein